MMGMMDMAAMPQGMPQEAPQQGMMSAPQGADPSLSHGKFNGTVTVNGEPVEVKAGVAQVGGKPFMVSDNGAIVIDHQGKLVGHIEGDEFVAADEAYLKQMQEAGYVR